MDTYILRESERERGEREKMKETDRQTDRQIYGYVYTERE